ncbi:MAG: response regulator transcription factor [Betaproteobacteria bacterium]|nr:MAG: response regulator transcription factor [Betaproteobacteria bacterium]
MPATLGRQDFPDTACRECRTDLRPACADNTGECSAQRRASAARARAVLSEESDLENPVVLIVEDHATLRATLRDWLENTVPGVSVLSAGSAEEALETVARVGADVVLMDIGLPGVNGIEGARLFRLRAPDTVVVMLSIIDDRAHVADALDAGAVAFVSKRTMRHDLLPALQAALKERLSRVDAHVERGGARP